MNEFSFHFAIETDDYGEMKKRLLDFDEMMRNDWSNKEEKVSSFSDTFLLHILANEQKTATDIDLNWENNHKVLILLFMIQSIYQQNEMLNSMTNFLRL